MNERVRAEIPEAFVAVFPPPPVAGIGNAGGYRLFIQDRGNAGLEELQTQAFAMMMKANQTPGITNNLTTFPRQCAAALARSGSRQSEEHERAAQ